MAKSFIIDIDPVAKGRPIKGVHCFYTPEKTKIFEETVRWLLKCQGAKYSNNPISLKLHFYIKRPKKCKRKYPSVRPDLDNYIKAIKDAGNRFLWKDDALIVDLTATKEYADKGSIIIEIEELIEYEKEYYTKEDY